MSNSGIGLPEAGLERIFEAFFTTKPDGTGMGLSISRRIIKSHGGRQRQCGTGRHFSVHLADGAVTSCQIEFRLIHVTSACVSACVLRFRANTAPKSVGMISHPADQP